MTTYYDDMSESAALNYLAGTTDFGDAAAIRLIAAYIDAATGTGSPEGVVTAPVGSTYIDTAATTGAIRWIKATGTGNTGWVVEYGDTGVRDLSSLVTANATDTIDHLRLRRSGTTVQLAARIANSLLNTAHELFSVDSGAIPSGFRPQSAYAYAQGGREEGAGSTEGALTIKSTGLTHYRMANASYITFTLTYLTSDAWPSSLPGSAA